MMQLQKVIGHAHKIPFYHDIGIPPRQKTPEVHILFNHCKNTLRLEERLIRSRIPSSVEIFFSMRTWLLRLGFIGEKFATAREVLTKRLAGDASFRHGRA